MHITHLTVFPVCLTIDRGRDTHEAERRLEQPIPHDHLHQRETFYTLKQTDISSIEGILIQQTLTLVNLTTHEPCPAHSPAQLLL